MLRNKKAGFAPIVALVALVAVLTIAAGGVVVWEKKISPTPSPTPVPYPQPTLTTPPAQGQHCATDNDCPKQMCQPAGQPCAQYYCTHGRCQLVEPLSNKQGGITGSLNEEIKLTPGQRVYIAGTNLSLTLLKITTPPQNCFDCPTSIKLEIRNGGETETVNFSLSGLVSQETLKRMRTKEVFGFRISIEEFYPESIVSRVQKL